MNTTFITRNCSLQLEKSLGLSDNPNLGKVQIPRRKSDDGVYYTFENDTATVSGYGWDWILLETIKGKRREVEGKSEHMLKFAVATVVNTADCQKHYRGPLVEGHLCAQVKQRNPEHYEGVCSVGLCLYLQTINFRNEN